MQIFWREKRWSPTTQVNFFYNWLTSQFLKDQIPLFAEAFNVRFLDGVINSNARVASAIGAQTLAIG
jgi:hypothetical protein